MAKGDLFFIIVIILIIIVLALLTTNLDLFFPTPAPQQLAQNVINATVNATA